MLRLALLAALLAGGAAKALLSEPKAGETFSETESQGIVGKLKAQLRSAQIAAREEKLQKEAELLAEYEATRAATHQHD